MKVIYDGDCPVCLGLKAYADERDREGNLAFIPYQAEDLAAHAPGLDPQEASQALYTFSEDGTPLRGAQAVIAVMKSLAGAWPVIARLLSIQPLAWLAERAYYLFAQHRHRIGSWLRGKNPGVISQ